jgi:hypothetical protein
VADQLQNELSVGVLGETVGESDLLLKDVVIENLEEIFHRFVINVGRPLA